MLNHDEKQHVLMSWQAEAYLLQAAESEGFDGGELCLSDDIDRCINRL
jgi:hypothetical protein